MEYIVPKVGFIIAGGTRLSLKEKHKTTIQKQSDIQVWMKYITDYRVAVNLTSFFVHGGDDFGINGEILKEITSIIAREYKKYEGFVISCGLPLLTYVSSAISFMLGEVGKPVVITGSALLSSENEFNKEMDRLYRKHSSFGIQTNIINACQTAVSNIGEICIVFGNEMVRATLAKPAMFLTTALIDPVANGGFGRVDFGIRLTGELRERRNVAFHPKVAFNDRVQYIDLSYRLSVEEILALLKEKDGLVVQTYFGAMPKDVQFLLEKLAKSMPVVMYCPHEYSYSFSPDFIPMSNVTQETAITKLMWALGQTKDIEKVRAIMLQPRADEFYSFDFIQARKIQEKIAQSQEKKKLKSAQKKRIHNEEATALTI